MENSQQNLRAKPGQYLTFMLKNQTYGMPIATVCEINRLIQISPVPQMPEFVSGVMNLRGKVVPVVDLGRRLGFGAMEASKDSCIIVIEGIHSQVGNIVDSVCGVVELSVSQIQAPPQLGLTAQQSFVTGLGQDEGRVIILVDAAEVLSHTEWNDVPRLQAFLAETEQKGAVI